MNTFQLTVIVAVCAFSCTSGTEANSPDLLSDAPLADGRGSGGLDSSVADGAQADEASLKDIVVGDSAPGDALVAEVLHPADVLDVQIPSDLQDTALDAGDLVLSDSTLVEDVGPEVCEPACDGKDCGDDGCGGDCGMCTGQDLCVVDLCVCQPACDGKDCGDDGCSGDCGACTGQDLCVVDQCVCQPACDGKDCGADGCGGDCGTCNDGNVCTTDSCGGNFLCETAPASGDCSDGDPCTQGDICSGGACEPGAEICGGSCTPCPNGDACDLWTDCASGYCGGGICLAPLCDDGVANGLETDTDCGGGCPKCLVGRGCEQNSDCIEDVCANDVCVIPPCLESDATGIPVHARLVGESQTPLEVICRPADSVFSLAVLPDTQMYTAATSPYPEMFTSQTQFLRVMYNHALNRMIFAIHLGDVVNNAGNPSEWPGARASMDKLAAFLYEGVEHFLPYDIAWGDHDVLSYWDNGTYPNNPRPKYTADIQSGVFSVANYKEDQTIGGNEWWKGFFRSYKSRFGRNSYHFFDAGGDEYMLLFLEYCPSPEVIAWAAQRLSWYAAGPKDRRAILVMHSFIDTAGGLHDTKYSTGHEKCWEFENGAINGGSPSDIFDQLIVPYNIHFVLNGHDNGGGWKGGTYSRIEVPAEASGLPDDRDVHVFLSNYQYVGSADPLDEMPNGTVGSGLGYFRMMRFYPDEDRIHVTVWSQYSKDHNDNKWNPTYAPDDPEGLNPMNFAGNPSSPFNEDQVCSEINTQANNPGRCGNWDTIPGLCGDLETYAAQYQLEHQGPPYRSYVTQCNRFSVAYPMTGSDSIP